MSYITDKAREPRRAAEGYITVPGQTLEEIVAANPARRKVLRGGLSLSLLSVFGSTSLLAACGGDDDPAPAPAPAPARPRTSRWTTASASTRWRTRSPPIP